MDRIYEVIKRHLLTEKTTRMKEYNPGIYAFEVLKDATKDEIKQAVERIFEVKVLKVNTMLMPGKKARFGRYIKKTSSWKKAVVTLEEGQKIAAFDNI